MLVGWEIPHNSVGYGSFTLQLRPYKARRIFMNFSRRFSIQPMSSQVRDLLNRWYKVGDSVVLNATGEESGIVLGFGKKYVPRGGFDHKKAGTHIDFAHVLVAPTSGAPERYVSVQQYDDPVMAGVCAGLSAIMIKIGDLPETPFWEGDRVRLKSVPKEADPDGWIVSDIWFDAILATEVGFLYRIKSLNPKLHCDKRDNELELIKRGNLWKMEHGGPVEFASIEEEAKFYQSLGMSVKLSHTLPQSNIGFGITGRSTDEWEWKDAVTEIRRGAADEMKLKNKKDMTFVLIKYDRMEFGNRMRAHTLAKLGFIETSEDEN